MRTNWKTLITDKLNMFGETWEDVVSHTLTEEQINECFDDGFGGVEGCAFTLWTKNRVYQTTKRKPRCLQHRG